MYAHTHPVFLKNPNANTKKFVNTFITNPKLIITINILIDEENLECKETNTN